MRFNTEKLGRLIIGFVVGIALFVGSIVSYLIYHSVI